MKKFSLTSMSVAIAGVLMLAASVLTLSVPQAHADQQRPQYASVTKDWASLVDGAGASQTVTVLGAALGDFCLASQSVDIVGMTMTCYISAADTATVRLQNESTATADLASSTLRVVLVRKNNPGG